MKVTFCGHSHLTASDTEQLEPKLYEKIENLILSGATEFLLGGYGEFDRLCASLVKKLKKKYPHIQSVLVIPYMDRDFDYSIYDCSEYPPIETVPKKFAILKRNEYMVECSDVLISHIRHTFGGAYKTHLFAKRKKIRIINI